MKVQRVFFDRPFDVGGLRAVSSLVASEGLKLSLWERFIRVESDKGVYLVPVMHCLSLRLEEVPAVPCDVEAPKEKILPIIAEQVFGGSPPWSVKKGK